MHCVPLKHWTSRYAPIPSDGLAAMIGECLHLGWATGPGFVWVLDRIEGDKLFLHTPKTGKRMVAKAKDAYYTRHWQQKLGLEKTA